MLSSGGGGVVGVAVVGDALELVDEFSGVVYLAYNFLVVVYGAKEPDGRVCHEYDET